MKWEPSRSRQDQVTGSDRAGDIASLQIAEALDPAPAIGSALASVSLWLVPGATLLG
jgi:hypothetical protein